MTPEYLSNTGEGVSPQPLPSHSTAVNFHPKAARGFAQTFGLHPGMALLLFVVDSMLFGGQFVTGGAFWPFSALAAVVLGIITFKAQKKWFGDNSENALIKALILGFLTAIPTALRSYLCIPAGVVGLFRSKE